VLTRGPRSSPVAAFKQGIVVVVLANTEHDVNTTAGKLVQAAST
jgi:hypothetical protein